MRERNLKILNFVLHVLFLALLAGFQTSFWREFFGALPPPLLWCVSLSYFAFYRSLPLGIFFVYVSSLIVSGFSGTGLGLILIVQMSLFVAGRFFKARIFWSGLTYQFILGGITVILFEIMSYLASWMFEENVVSRLSFWRLSFQLVLTTLVTPSVLWFIRHIDNWTETDLTLVPGAREI